MDKNLQKLIDGLRWLADGGRDAARLLQAELREDDINVAECVAWLEDIANDTEI